MGSTRDYSRYQQHFKNVLSGVCSFQMSIRKGSAIILCFVLQIFIDKSLESALIKTKLWVKPALGAT